MQLDHVVIQGLRPHHLVSWYTHMGFTVVPGGENSALGTRHARIALADNTCLELVGFHSSPDPALAIAPAVARMQAWRNHSWQVVDWALVTDSLPTTLAAARAHELRLDGPIPGSYQWPDGTTIAWEYGIPDGFDLPFLCADVTPRSLRVPDREARRHANGALGIHSLLIAVADLEAGVERYAALLGIPLQLDEVAAAPNSRTASFGLNGILITLATPLGAGQLAHRLATCGDGPLRLILRTEQGLRWLQSEIRVPGRAELIPPPWPFT